MRIMWSVSALAAVLVSCGGDAGGGGGGNDDEDIGEVHGTWACDGSQSAFDWLVVVEATSTGPVDRVWATVIQGSNEVGTISLDEGNPGDWYGDAWEDDLGCDCESAVMDVELHFE